MNILELNPQFLFGISGLIGAGLRGILSYIKKVKENNLKVGFDLNIFIETLVKGVTAGIIFSIGLPITYVALIVTALSGAGIDTYLNKFGINIIPTLRKYITKKK